METAPSSAGSPGDDDARPRLDVTVDRRAPLPLSEQIAASIRTAILEGRLAPRARLPSWQDLAVQLGVARGTVRAAYERLVDEALVIPSGSAGTLVARQPPAPAAEPPRLRPPLHDFNWQGYLVDPLPFEMGIPAQDAFPRSQWARALGQAARQVAEGVVSHPDPRGMPELREQIAVYLAIARGVHCVPDQIIVTGGFRSSLSIVLAARGAPGADAWMEDPGYPVTRNALLLTGLRPRAVAVDDEGIDVAQGIAMAPDAALAVVTPGQQYPLGVGLSEARRSALVSWAREAGSWIVEDDFLSELQLDRRASRALAAGPAADVVFHAGTFAKTMSPSAGLGFLVLPLRLAEHVSEVAAHLAPSPSPVAQLALATFMRQGHYMRHLRRMKRLYAARRAALVAELEAAGHRCQTSGLGVLLWLPPGCVDVEIGKAARAKGLVLVSMSPWFSDAARRRHGFLLGVTNLTPANLRAACDTLYELIDGARRG